MDEAIEGWQGSAQMYHGRLIRCIGMMTMAKQTKRNAPKDRYAFIRAYVDCGELRWEYRIVGNRTVGRQSHDEDVSEMTEADIVALTRNMLCVEPYEKVDVIYT